MGNFIKESRSQEPSVEYSRKSMGTKKALHDTTQHRSVVSNEGNRRDNVLIRQTPFLFIEGSSGESFPDYAKTQEDLCMILKALNSYFIFTSLTEEDKEIIANTMQLHSFPPEAIVFKKGCLSRSFYIVKAGSVDVYVKGRRVNRIKEGEGFGELALINDNTRSATLKCADFTLLFVIEREMFKKVIEDISTEAFDQNRVFLDKINLLASLSSNQKDLLAANMTSIKFLPGENIIVEGEKGDRLYIIKEGTVRVTRKGQELNRLQMGAYFGEQALISHSTRNATCTAIDGTVKCVCLSREVLQQILNYKLQDITEKNSIMEALNRSETLGILKKAQKEAIYKDLSIINYRAGDIVIPRGLQCSSKLFVIVSGRIQNSKNSFLFADKGNCVGDVFINKGKEDVYEDDLIASTNIRVAEISKYQIEISLGGKYDQIVKENYAIQVLRKILLFKNMTDKHLKYLLSVMKIIKCSKGQIILREGQHNDTIYIVKRGVVEIFKSGKLMRAATKFGYFGHDWIIGSDIINCTYIAAVDVALWIVNRVEFMKLVNADLENELLHKAKYEEQGLELNSLTIMSLLGRGMFSRVYLVKSAKNALFALKIYSRRKINKLYINQQIINEKQVLSQIDHPFIMKYIKSFKDDKRIYLLLEYVQGLDLEALIISIGVLTIRDAAFYIGALIITLQYLHERDILYRDLKPENIIIDDKGYPKLIDFNSAKVVQGKSYTMVGCPYYTAPEVIAGKGFSKNSDIWSLGVLLYELVCGRLPFGQTQEDPYKIYAEILENKVEIPFESNLNQSTTNLINILLNKAPDRHSGRIEKLKRHEFFNQFDWDELDSGSLVPPFKSDAYPPEEASDDEDESRSWDEIIANDSDDSSDSLPEITDNEINDYKLTIPYNWDEAFG